MQHATQPSRVGQHNDRRFDDAVKAMRLEVEKAIFASQTMPPCLHVVGLRIPIKARSIGNVRLIVERELT